MNIILEDTQENSIPLRPALNDAQENSIPLMPVFDRNKARK